MTARQTAESICGKHLVETDPATWLLGLENRITAALEEKEREIGRLTNERDMYMDKVSDLGMEAQREVLRHIDTRQERDQLKAQLNEAVRLLTNLHGLVRGECPRLFDEDSGGTSDIHIEAFLASVKGGKS